MTSILKCRQWLSPRFAACTGFGGPAMQMKMPNGKPETAAVGLSRTLGVPQNGQLCLLMDG
jgi:hypothetical protein